jgi:cAMP-dependent protein kinase regulator
MVIAAADGLSRLAPFAALDAPSLASIVDRLETITVQDGETVLREGDDGACMYVIARGAFRVERCSADRSPRALTELGEGEFFGEMSLLSGAPRFATVVSVGAGELLRLDRRDLDAIVASHPHVGEVLDRFYKERLVANVLRASRLFRLIAEARPEPLAEIVHVETHAPGTVLLEQGQPGKGFFLLLRGTCDVFHRSSDGRELAYPAMGEGDVFGEISLLQDGSVTATVRARTRAVVLAMTREWFDQLVLGPPSVRSEIYALATERTERTREMLVHDELEWSLI